MAEARIECLKVLLGGSLPKYSSPYSQALRMPADSTMKKPDATSSPKGKKTNVEIGDTSLETYEEDTNIKRLPLAAGPRSSSIAVSQLAITSTPILAVAHSRERESLQDQYLGRITPLGVRFSPFNAVVKWPYKFIDKAYMQPVATAFFDAEKVWLREWDLYYVWSEDYPTAQPVVLVTVAQLQELVDEVNNAFPDLKWAFDHYHEERGLVLDFLSADPDLRPRWLGRSNSRETYAALVDDITSPIPKSTSASASDLAAFQESIDLAVDLGRNRSRRSKSSTNTAAITMAKKQKTLNQLYAARRYLGLREDTAQTGISTASTTHQGVDPVLIAIDVESYERNHSQVTEVGVATLDTRDILGIDPGTRGVDWHKCIRARHFLISEHRHLVNRAFVRGCPDAFEFGTSESISLRDLAKVLASCFNAPYGGSSDAEDESEEKRDLVLVGHAVKEDINYCHQIGFSLLHRSNLVNTLDTSSIYRAIPKDHNKSSLGSILHEYGFEAWNQHNAGNDAVYTLWALLGMCVGGSSAQNPQSTVAEVSDAPVDDGQCEQDH